MPVLGHEVPSRKLREAENPHVELVSGRDLGATFGLQEALDRRRLGWIGEVDDRDLLALPAARTSCERGGRLRADRVATLLQSIVSGVLTGSLYAMIAVGLTHFLVLAACLFVLGLVCAVTRRNAVAVLIGIELMLNAANLAFVAYAHSFEALSGQIFVFFIMTVAAAEVAVGLALIVAIFRNKHSIDVDEISNLRG